MWSSNIDRALRVAGALRAGTVHVNSYDEDDMTVPFGGYKQSGNGRDKSLHAFDKYTELKTTWIRLAAKYGGCHAWALPRERSSGSGEIRVSAAFRLRRPLHGHSFGKKL